MSQIVLSDEEVQKIGASRWLNKQAKSFMAFWFIALFVFIVLTALVYKITNLNQSAVIIIGVFFTLVFWGAYERIFGKPSRLAGIAFLKEYRQ